MSGTTTTHVAEKCWLIAVFVRGKVGEQHLRSVPLHTLRIFEGNGKIHTKAWQADLLCPIVDDNLTRLELMPFQANWWAQWHGRLHKFAAVRGDHIDSEPHSMSNLTGFTHSANRLRLDIR